MCGPSPRHLAHVPTFHADNKIRPLDFHIRQDSRAMRPEIKPHGVRNAPRTWLHRIVATRG